MGFENVAKVFEALANLFSGVEGAGVFLAALGIIMLLATIGGFVVWALIGFIKRVPKMTLGEFLKFIVVFSGILIVLGILVP
ncbi:MAG: hypothetical protein QXN38_01575 [Desulfurococcaceae archaeon]